jgi:hypothetical protein
MNQDHRDKTDEWDMKGGLRPPTSPSDRFIVYPPGSALADHRTFPTSEMAEAYAEAYCPPHTWIMDRYPYQNETDPAPSANPPNPKQRYGDTKVNLALIPSAGLIYAALGLHDGAIKYGPFNWRQDRVEIMTYIAAAMRHLLAFVDGEELSEEELWNHPDMEKHWATVHLGQKPHLGHAIACLMILADAISLDHVIDNRPLPGPAPSLLQKWKRDLAR